MELIEKDLTQKVIGAAMEIRGVSAPLTLILSPASGERRTSPLPFQGEGQGEG
jgi:hypothetical protein